MPTFDEVHQAYDERLAKSRPDSPRAFYEIAVPRFTLMAAVLPFWAGSVLATYRAGLQRGRRSAASGEPAGWEAARGEWPPAFGSEDDEPR